MEESLKRFYEELDGDDNARNRWARETALELVAKPWIVYDINPPYVRSADMPRFLRDAIDSASRVVQHHMVKAMHDSFLSADPTDIRNAIARAVQKATVTQEDIRSSDLYWVTINPLPEQMVTPEARAEFFSHLCNKYAQRTAFNSVRITPETRTDDTSLGGMHVHMLIALREKVGQKQFFKWTFNTFKRYVGGPQVIRCTPVLKDTYRNNLEAYMTREEEKHSDDPLLREELGVTQGQEVCHKALSQDEGL